MGRKGVVVVVVTLALLVIGSTGGHATRRMAVIDDLIEYWALDESSGNAVSANSADDLTDNNTVGATTGVVSGARNLDNAATEYFSKADNAALSLGSDTAFTWAGWIKSDDAFPQNKTILSKQTAGDTQHSEYVLQIDNNFRYSFGLGDGTNTASVDPGGYIDPTSWTFMVAWHDPAADKIYLQLNNGTVYETAWTHGTQDTAADFRLGNGFSGISWDGQLDEWGFWKKVMTSDERTWLYNAGAGRSYADIVAEAGGGGGWTQRAQDTFTDTATTALGSHTPDSGSGWTEYSPGTTCAWTINAFNQVQAAGVSAYCIAFNGTVLEDTQADEINCQRAGAGGNYCGLVLRGDSSSHNFMQAQWDVNAGDMFIFQFNGGSRVDLDGGLCSTNFPGSTFDTMRFEASGTTYRVLVNSVEKLACADTTYTSGKAGLFSEDGTAYLMDLFNAYDSAEEMGSTRPPGISNHPIRCCQMPQPLHPRRLAR